jgi:drug/metabolite transporter (DMT)-like permease
LTDQFVSKAMQQAAPIIPQQTASWLEVAAVALFPIGAQLFISQALVCIPAPKVSVMMTTEVPLVTVFGVLYLGEPIGWRLRGGALLIFGSGIGLNLRPDRSTSN